MQILKCPPALWGQDSIFGIATRHGLDVLRWNPGGVKFCVLGQTGPGAHPTSCTVGTGSFLGVKWPGHGVDHPPPSSAEVKGRVELYTPSPWAFVDFYRWNLTFFFFFNLFTSVLP